jgi:hypothetical protein
MGLLGKIKNVGNSVYNAQKDAISSVQNGVTHAANEIKDELHDPIKKAGITMDQLDELQQSLVQAALDQQGKILKDAQEQANNIISNATKEIEKNADKIKELILEAFCEKLISSGKWYKVLLGKIILSQKELILKEI